MSSAAGRESLAVYRSVLRRLSDEQRLAKAFELTEATRQTMKAGIRSDNPDLPEEEIHQIYVRRLLAFQGIDYDEIIQKMKQSNVDSP